MERRYSEFTWGVMHTKVLTLEIEWEQKPASPSSIRLISFGKLLDDKAPLKGKSRDRLAWLEPNLTRGRQIRNSSMTLQMSFT